VSFAVAADAYDRFMGRYSQPLAPVFADYAGLASGQRVLDVGCGPGALTAELVSRLGAEAVSAVDPSAQFVEAVEKRHPGVTVHQAPAENLPFTDDTFGAALAQLVVHFMADQVAGLREMSRVTRPGGSVAACVWDHSRGGKGPLSPFWEGARDLGQAAADESSLPGTQEGQLAEYFAAAGLSDIEDGALTISVEHATFEDWWDPYTLGVGPAGAFVAGLEDAQIEQLRESCRSRLPEPPFTLTAVAWTARGRAPA
jgi:SAM-dependent methyltransferase